MAGPAAPEPTPVPAGPPLTGDRKGPARVFEAAPEEDLLYSMSADGKRKFIHVNIAPSEINKIFPAD